MSDDDNTVLLDAILSMDVYNREKAVTSPEISNALAATGDTLGSATIVDSKFDPNTAFGAVTWEYNRNLIIAYRGTVGSQFFTEAANGYGVGAGSPLGPQAAEALAYYQATEPNVDEYANSGVIVTGHSLGGGLAGFVGAIYGLHGNLFNNMPFELAAQQAYSLSIDATENPATEPDGINFQANWLLAEVYGEGVKPFQNNITGLTTYYVSGEVLQYLRSFQKTPQIPLLSDTQGTAGVGPGDYHSAPLMVAALYAQDSGDNAWKSVSASFYQAVFGEEAGRVSQALGLSQPQDLLTEIAYSAVATATSSQASLPFGSTKLASMFSDADNLGEDSAAGDFSGALQSIPDISGYGSALQSPISPVDALMEIAVQYAGDQAAAAQTDQVFDEGAFSEEDGALSINLTESDWTTTFQDGLQGKIAGVSDLVQGVVYNTLEPV